MNIIKKFVKKASLTKPDPPSDSVTAEPIELTQPEEEWNFYKERCAVLTAALRSLPLHRLDTSAIRNIYESLRPVMDYEGFYLFRAAEDILGKFSYATFPYEDLTGHFEDMDGHELLSYLLVQYDYLLGTYDLPRWEIVAPGYERCVNLSVDKTTSEYKDFERKLYIRVLERLGVAAQVTSTGKGAAA